MNKDIQTLIEREAEKLDSAIQHCKDIQDENCTNESCKNDHHQLEVWLEELKFLKSLFKWRKVSEGLLDDNARVLVKSKRGGIYLSCYSQIDGFSSNANITEWMPIPNIGD